MKILLLIDAGINDHEQDVAGRYWEEVTRGLMHDVAFEVATLRKPGWLHEKFRSAGLIAHAIGYRGLFSLPLAAFRLRTLCVRDGITIIHANEVIPALVAGLVRRSGLHVHVLFHRQHARTSGRHRLASRIAATLADRTIAISPAVARAAVKLDRTAPTEIDVILSGVPVPRFPEPHETQSLRSRLGVEDGAQIVVAIGRLRVEKGHSVLINAFARLLKSTQRLFHLVIVGEGPELSALSIRAHETSDRVHLVGHASDVAPYLDMADVFVQPSLAEGFGLSVAEAMAYGVPVVASKVDGLIDVVGEAGILVPPGDPGALAHSLLGLLDDEELRAQLAVAGRRRFEERFTVRRMTRELVDVYSRMGS